MSDLYETMVEQFITRNGLAMVCPQTDFLYSTEGKSGGSCPDFVVLDLQTSTLVVVEVSANSNINELVEKVRDRRQRWYKPLAEWWNGFAIGKLNRLAEMGDLRVLCFVRQDRLLVADKRLGGADHPDVTWFPLEQTAFSHRYWDDRGRGLPDVRFPDRHPAAA